MNDLSLGSLYTDFQGLAKLRHAARQQSPQALQEAARQFEGLFIHLMLKSMRDTVSEESLLDNDQTRFYQGLYDQQIALDLSGGGGIGLAELLYRQLGGEPEALAVPQSPTQRNAAYGASDALSTKTVQSTTTAVDSAQSFAETPEQFIEMLWPHAVNAGKRLGLVPEVLIAQAALETGWGRYTIQTSRGDSSYNFFGIKADSRWQGRRVRKPSLEYQDGIAVRKPAVFRAYDSIAASFADYANFISTNPRYRTALAQAHDPQAYLRGLQQSGYATDPRYADKILSIMSRDYFRKAVSHLAQA